MTDYLVKSINYLFVFVPIYCACFTLFSFAALVTFKFLHPEKRFPEMVAMSYGGVIGLVFWLVYVVKI